MRPVVRAPRPLFPHAASVQSRRAGNSTSCYGCYCSSSHKSRGKSRGLTPPRLTRNRSDGSWSTLRLLPNASAPLGWTLPALPPALQTGDTPLTLPPQTYAFSVLPEWRAAACT